MTKVIFLKFVIIISQKNASSVKPTKKSPYYAIKSGSFNLCLFLNNIIKIVTGNPMTQIRIKVRPIANEIYL
jgi:hypothetical protein